MPGTATVTDAECKVHHCLWSQHRDTDSHLESFRISQALLAALDRKAEAERADRNDAIRYAVDAWLASKGTCVREKGLGPGKTLSFRVRFAQWNQLTARAAELGAKPAACINAAILSYAMPGHAEARRGTAEIAPVAHATPKPAAKEKRRPPVRTERPAPVPAPRDERAPVVAELQKRAKAAGHDLKTASELAGVTGAAAIFMPPGASESVVPAWEVPDPVTPKPVDCRHRIAPGAWCKICQVRKQAPATSG